MKEVTLDKKWVEIKIRLRTLGISCKRVLEVKLARGTARVKMILRTIEKKRKDPNTRRDAKDGMGRRS
jgi:hypothetical protein